MAEPDDPLRADDALVGAQHEDVLLGSGPVEDEPVEPVLGEVDEIPVAVAVLDDRPTTELPPVVLGPAPEPPGKWAGAAPWAVFAVVAVVVIAATTTWASWLQGPTAERQSFTGLLQPVPTSTASAPQVVEAAPAPSPEPEAEPSPEPERQPVARPTQRPTQRPRATRTPAPAVPPPSAAGVNAPVTPTGKPQNESAAKTSAPSGAAAAEADDREQDEEKKPADADKATPEDEKDSSSDD